MSNLVVSQLTLEVNGATFNDIISFTDNSVQKHIMVPMMSKTGFAKMTPRYGFSVEVTYPRTPSGIDLDNVENGTFTVEYDNGSRTLYQGVYTLDTGDKATTGDSETVTTKAYGATNKIEK